MKICIISLLLIVLSVTSYKIKNNREKIVNIISLYDKNYIKKNSERNKCILETYNDYIHKSAIYYGVDECLIKAIIQVESNYNPTVISKSNAIGLMQLKAETAGRDVYRLKGKIGEPSIYELKDAAINIDFGTAYLSILQKQLEGIINSEIRRYAIIVAYVNGLSALLHMFSVDSSYAIRKINTFTPEGFYRYIQRYHPSKQAQRYLFKVNTIYILQK